MINNSFGLLASDLTKIIEVVSQYKEVKRAIIFGSRAKGNFRQGSDIDLAILCEDKNIANAISFKLNEDTLLPYKFDVLDYRTIDNKELISHIDRLGKVVFERD
jgi:predicted nucleotidyltransferase